MENKQVTIKDLIGMSINELRKLNIPAGLLNQFGPPIAKALDYMTVCYGSIEEAEKAAQKEAADQEEAPVLQLVDEGGNENDAEKDQLEGTVQE